MRVLLLILVLLLCDFAHIEPAELPLTEDQALRMAAQTYECQYSLLYAIRKSENGRRGFEFGIMDKYISQEIRENWPQEHWQYYQAAKSVRMYQDRFIRRHITLFARFTVRPWVGAQHQSRHRAWVRNTVYHYKRCKQ